MREWVAERLFGSYIEQRVSQAVREVDDRWWQQVGLRPEDRPWYETRGDLVEALEAWRDNPLARRIVSLTTDYVVGEGIRLRSEDEGVREFLDRFWSHPQNRIGLRLGSWCDELTRSGELFLLLSRNPADGMSYVRSIPAVHITQVVTDEEDGSGSCGTGRSKLSPTWFRGAKPLVPSPTRRRGEADGRGGGGHRRWGRRRRTR